MTRTPPPELSKALMHLTLKAATDEGVIAGVANVMELQDLGGDIIHRGAFNKTLADQGGLIPLEIDHGSGLMAECGMGQFSVEENNLTLTRGEINLEARDVREEIYPRLKFRQRLGKPIGLSIVYSIPRGKSQLRDGVRHIYEVKLYKVGIVDFPMNQASYISDVKSVEGASPMNPFEEALGKSLADVLANLAIQDQLRTLLGERWRLERAMSDTIDNVMRSQDLTTEDQRAAVAQLLTDFHTLTLAWVERYQAIAEALTPEVVETEFVEASSADPDTTVKSGRTISTANRQHISRCKALLADATVTLDALLQQAEPEPTTPADAEPPLSQDLDAALTAAHALLCTIKSAL